MARILVTGSAGFIGSHLTCSLLEMGHEVTGIDNINEDYDTEIKQQNASRATAVSSGDYTFHRGDIRDEELVSRVVQDQDYVFHLAGKAGVPKSVEEPELYHEINTQSTIQLLKACENAGVHRFVLASTSSVYGDSDDLPYTEDQHTEPVSPYGISKRAAEMYTMAWNDLYDLNTVALRYFTVYGPWMRTGMAIPDFTARAVEEGEPFIFKGDGSHTRDFTHVQDVVRANMALIGQGSADGEILNISSDNRVNVQDIAELILEETNSDKEVEHVEERAGDVEHTGADIDKAHRLLGYDPEIDIYEGVHDFLGWYRRNKGWYHPMALEASRQ